MTTYIEPRKATVPELQIEVESCFVIPRDIAKGGRALYLLSCDPHYLTARETKDKITILMQYARKSSCDWDYYDASGHYHVTSQSFRLIEQWPSNNAHIPVEVDDVDRILDTYMIRFI